MLKDVDDDAVLTFVEKGSDRDGYPTESIARVAKVLGGELIKVRGDYGIETYETKTDEYEYVTLKSPWGFTFECWRKKA